MSGYDRKHHMLRGKKPQPSYGRHGFQRSGTSHYQDNDTYHYHSEITEDYNADNQNYVEESVNYLSERIDNYLGDSFQDDIEAENQTYIDERIPVQNNRIENYHGDISHSFHDNQVESYQSETIPEHEYGEEQYNEEEEYYDFQTHKQPPPHHRPNKGNSHARKTLLCDPGMTDGSHDYKEEGFQVKERRTLLDNASVEIESHVVQESFTQRRTLLVSEEEAYLYSEPEKYYSETVDSSHEQLAEFEEQEPYTGFSDKNEYCDAERNVHGPDNPGRHSIPPPHYPSHRGRRERRGAFIAKHDFTADSHGKKEHKVMSRSTGYDTHHVSSRPVKHADNVHNTVLGSKDRIQKQGKMSHPLRPAVKPQQSSFSCDKYNSGKKPLKKHSDKSVGRRRDKRTSGKALLPTPYENPGNVHSDSYVKKSFPSTKRRQTGLLPTPTASPIISEELVQTSTSEIDQIDVHPRVESTSSSGLLPTPTTRELDTTFESHSKQGVCEDSADDLVQDNKPYESGLMCVNHPRWSMRSEKQLLDTWEHIEGGSKLGDTDDKSQVDGTRPNDNNHPKQLTDKWKYFDDSSNVADVEIQSYRDVPFETGLMNVNHPRWTAESEEFIPGKLEQSDDGGQTSQLKSIIDYHHMSKPTSNFLIAPEIVPCSTTSSSNESVAVEEHNSPSISNSAQMADQLKLQIELTKAIEGMHKTMQTLEEKIQKTPKTRKTNSKRASLEINTINQVVNEVPLKKNKEETKSVLINQNESTHSSVNPHNDESIQFQQINAGSINQVSLMEKNQETAFESNEILGDSEMLTGDGGKLSETEESPKIEQPELVEEQLGVESTTGEEQVSIPGICDGSVDMECAKGNLQSNTSEITEEHFEPTGQREYRTYKEWRLAKQRMNRHYSSGNDSSREFDQDMRQKHKDERHNWFDENTERSVHNHNERHLADRRYSSTHKDNHERESRFESLTSQRMDSARHQDSDMDSNGRYQRSSSRSSVDSDHQTKRKNDYDTMKSPPTHTDSSRQQNHKISEKTHYTDRNSMRSPEYEKRYYDRSKSNERKSEHSKSSPRYCSSQEQHQKRHQHRLKSDERYDKYRRSGKRSDSPDRHHLREYKRPQDRLDSHERPEQFRRSAKRSKSPEHSTQIADRPSGDETSGHHRKSLEHSRSPESHKTSHRKEEHRHSYEHKSRSQNIGEHYKEKHIGDHSTLVKNMKELSKRNVNITADVESKKELSDNLTAEKHTSEADRDGNLFSKFNINTTEEVIEKSEPITSNEKNGNSEIENKLSDKKVTVKLFDVMKVKSHEKKQSMEKQESNSYKESRTNFMSVMPERGNIFERLGENLSTSTLVSVNKKDASKKKVESLTQSTCDNDSSSDNSEDVFAKINAIFTKEKKKKTISNVKVLANDNNSDISKIVKSKEVIAAKFNAFGRNKSDISDTNDKLKPSSSAVVKKKKELVKHLRRVNETLFWKNHELKPVKIKLKRLNKIDVHKLRKKVKEEARCTHASRESSSVLTSKVFIENFKANTSAETERASEDVAKICPVEEDAMQNVATEKEKNASHDSEKSVTSKTKKKTHNDKSKSTERFKRIVAPISSTSESEIEREVLQLKRVSPTIFDEDSLELEGSLGSEDESVLLDIAFDEIDGSCDKDFIAEAKSIEPDKHTTTLEECVKGTNPLIRSRFENEISKSKLKNDNRDSASITRMPESSTCVARKDESVEGSDEGSKGKKSNKLTTLVPPETCSSSASKCINRKRDHSSDSSDDERFIDKNSGSMASHGKPRVSQYHAKSSENNHIPGNSGDHKHKEKPKQPKNLCNASPKSNLFPQLDGHSDPMFDSSGESSGDEGDVEDNSDDDNSSSQDLFADIDVVNSHLMTPVKSSQAHCRTRKQRSVVFDDVSEQRNSDSQELSSSPDNTVMFITKSQKIVESDDSTNDDSGTPTEEEIEDHITVKEEPKWLLHGYTQEPDTIFLSDDDEMVMSCSQPVILVSDEDSNDAAENVIPVVTKVKNEKKELIDDKGTEMLLGELLDSSSAEDWSDKGSDFEPDQLFSNFRKISKLNKARNTQLQSYSSDSNISSNENEFHPSKERKKEKKYDVTFDFVSSDDAVMAVEEDYLNHLPKKGKTYQKIKGDKTNITISSDDDEILASCDIDFGNTLKDQSEDSDATEPESHARLMTTVDNASIHSNSDSNGYVEMTPFMQDTQVDPELNKDDPSNGASVFDFHSEHFSDITDNDENVKKKTDDSSEDSDIMILDDSFDTVHQSKGSKVTSEQQKISKTVTPKNHKGSLYQAMTQMMKSNSSSNKKSSHKFTNISDDDSDIYGVQTQLDAFESRYEEKKLRLRKNSDDISVVEESEDNNTDHEELTQVYGAGCSHERNSDMIYEQQTQVYDIGSSLEDVTDVEVNEENDVYEEQTQVDNDGVTVEGISEFMDSRKGRNVDMFKEQMQIVTAGTSSITDISAPLEDISDDNIENPGFSDPQLTSYFQNTQVDANMHNSTINSVIGIKYDELSTDKSDTPDEDVYNVSTQVSENASSDTIKDDDIFNVSTQVDTSANSIKNDDYTNVHDSLAAAVHDDYNALTQIDDFEDDELPDIESDGDIADVMVDPYTSATQVDMTNDKFSGSSARKVTERSTSIESDESNSIDLVGNSSEQSDNGINIDDPFVSATQIDVFEERTSGIENNHKSFVAKEVKNQEDSNDCPMGKVDLYESATQIDNGNDLDKNFTRIKNKTSSDNIEISCRKNAVTKYNLAYHGDSSEESEDPYHSATQIDPSCSKSRGNLLSNLNEDQHQIKSNVTEFDHEKYANDFSAATQVDMDYSTENDADDFNTATQMDEIQVSDDSTENDYNAASQVCGDNSPTIEYEYDNFNMATQADDDFPVINLVDSTDDEVKGKHFSGAHDEQAVTKTKEPSPSVTNDGEQVKLDNTNTNASVKSALKRPNTDAVSKSVTFGQNDGIPAPKRPKIVRSLSRHVLPTDPQRLKSVKEKRHAGVKIVPTSTNSAQQISSPTSDIDIVDASRKDMWLSKKAPPQNRILDRVKDSRSCKRKRKEDLDSALRAKMQAARSQIRERLMHTVSQPESVGKRLKKTLAEPSTEVDDVALPSDSQIIGQGLPLLNPVGILHKGNKTDVSHPGIISVSTSTSTASSTTSTVSSATSASLISTTVTSTSSSLKTSVLAPHTDHTSHASGSKHVVSKPGKSTSGIDRKSKTDGRRNERKESESSKTRDTGPSKGKKHNEVSGSDAGKTRTDHAKHTSKTSHSRDKENKEKSGCKSIEERSRKNEKDKKEKSKSDNSDRSKQRKQSDSKDDHSKNITMDSSSTTISIPKSTSSIRKDKVVHPSGSPLTGDGALKPTSVAVCSTITSLSRSSTKSCSSSKLNSVNKSCSKSSTSCSTLSKTTAANTSVLKSTLASNSLSSATSVSYNKVNGSTSQTRANSAMNNSSSVGTFPTVAMTISTSTCNSSKTTSSISASSTKCSVRPSTSSHIQSSVLLQKRRYNETTTKQHQGNYASTSQCRQPFGIVQSNIPAAMNGLPYMVEKNPQFHWHDFLKVILKWNPLWFQEKEYFEKKNQRIPMPPITNDLLGHNEHRLFPLINSYVDYKEYNEKFMLPLLLHETWECCYSTWRQAKSHNQVQEHGVCFSHIEQKKEAKAMKTVQYILLGLISDRDRWARRYVNEGELVKITAPGTVKVSETETKQQQYDIMGYVDSVVFKDTPVNRMISHFKCLGEYQNRMKDCISMKIFVTVRNRAFVPSATEIIQIQSISSIVNTYRQFNSLSLLPLSPLCQSLLHPTSNMVYCDKAQPMIQNEENKKYNRSQSIAINTAAKICSSPPEVPRVCLLQGPPGTGKSHTIVGIIKEIIKVRKGECRICLCAPSNAAVDVLLKRLRFKDNENRRSDIRMVRLGKQNSVHKDIQDYCLDHLVDKNIQQARKEQMLMSLPKSLLAEIKNREREIQGLVSNSKSKTTSELQKQKLNIDLKGKMKDLEQMKSKYLVPQNTPVDRNEEGKMRKKVLMKAQVIAGTLSSIGSGILRSCFQGIKPAFHVAIIDEASQAVELETLIPLQYGVSKLVLVGDPNQLPPTVISQVASDNKFNLSLFERLDKNFQGRPDNAPNPVILLDTQYRMNSEIALFPNEYIYDGKLKNDKSVIERRRSMLAPYIFFDISEGREMFSQGTRSMSNPLEAQFTAELCEFIVSEKAFKAQDIGVIAPYAKQKAKVQQLLNSKNLKDVEVSTVDGFQGREKNVIVMTCVRANMSGSVGFVGKRSRMNVSLTRARYAMYLVGNLESLESNEEWKILIDNARSREKVVPVDKYNFKRSLQKALLKKRK